MADQTFAVHCGFFDAINSDRTYSADEMNRPYRRVISNGVFATPQGNPSTDLQVVESSGMNIICKAGEGLFADKWFENPSSIVITVPDNTSTVPRIDSVLVQVDTRTSGRVGNIVHRTGTPASSPVPPAINQTEGVVEYRLANIRVNAGVTSIMGRYITDRRGSSDCPWVTSLIYQVDTSTLYDQWQAAYEEYFEAEKAIWDAWYAQLTEDLDVSMTLDRHVNTVTTTPQTTGYIPIGLAYNHNTDILEVYINGLRAVEGTHYVVVDDTKILVENQLQIGQEVTFVVMRSVISGSATNIMVLLQELESQIAGVAGGTPTVVDSASDMTDTEKIYILSSDSKWYYYSATAEDWVIGGTYGGVPTDTTLTQQGMAADAKAVGDALAEKANADDVTALDTRVSDLKEDLNEFEFGAVTFSVDANTSHSSLEDQISINIPQGAIYKVTTAGMPRSGVLFEIPQDGVAIEQNVSVPASGSVLYVALTDIVKIGIYIASSTDDYTASITVEVIGGRYNLIDRSATGIYGINNTIGVVATWERGILNATGNVSNGNGATTALIENVTGLMLADGCRAVLTAYNNGIYVGKYNANGGFDKVQGNWGYLTGYVDITNLLAPIEADGIRISVLPTNSAALTVDTVSTYGNNNASFYVIAKDQVNAIVNKSIFVNWWMRGTVASNGSNSTALNRLRSDFICIRNAEKIRLDFPDDCYMSYTFYNDVAITSFISQSPAWVTESSVIDVPDSANYVRLTYRQADNSDITVDDFVFNSVKVGLATPVDRILQADEIPIQENTIIRTINHRGYNADAPENTLPAYRLSRKHGFKYVETDVAFTSDGVAVCLHDETINRTARNADGTAISETIYIKNITYAQALTYDYGIWKAPEFAGTKLPTYKEWLLLCKKLSLHPVTEIKNGDFSESQARVIADTVKSVGMEHDVSFISFMPQALNYMRSYFPDAWMALAPNGTYSEALFNACITNINTLKEAGTGAVVASVNYDNMTDTYYDMLASAGIGTLIWTVDQSEKLTTINDTVTAVLSDTLKAATIIMNYNVT